MDNFIIYRSAIGKTLNLNYLILREMDDVRNHKSRALPFGFFFIKVFKNFWVSFRNQHDQHIDGSFTEYLIRRGISIDTMKNEENE